MNPTEGNRRKLALTALLKTFNNLQKFAQFIARKQSAAEGDGGEDNLGVVADNLTLNGGTLPQIKVTESNENREEEMNGINEKEQKEFGRNIAKNQPNG